jgi:hypothetical protein
MNIEWIQTHPNTLYSKIAKFVSKIGLGTELNSEIKLVLSKVLNLDSESIERKNIFESIYEKNVWNNADPRIPLSGRVSSIENTKNIAKLLDDFVQDTKCVSVTDLGCGDLTWMSNTSLFQNEKISYVGIDIAEPLIIKHSFAYPKKLFLNKDIVTNNDIPHSSLIIIRDVIFHLSIKDVQSIFRNIQGKFDYIAITSCNNLKNEDNFNVYHFNQRNINIEPFCISNNFIKSCDEPVFNRKFYIYSHDKFYNQVVTQKNTVVITTTLANNQISKKRQENLDKTITLPIVFIQGEKIPVNRNHYVTRKLIEYFKETDYEYGILCDDDFHPHPNFILELNKTVRELPADWRSLYLCPGWMWGRKFRRCSVAGALDPEGSIRDLESHTSGRFFMNCDPTLYESKRIWLGGPIAILVNRKTIDSFLKDYNSLKDIQKPNDVILTKMLTKNDFICRDPQLGFENEQGGSVYDPLV